MASDCAPEANVKRHSSLMCELSEDEVSAEDEVGGAKSRRPTWRWSEKPKPYRCGMRTSGHQSCIHAYVPTSQLSFSSTVPGYLASARLCGMGQRKMSLLGTLWAPPDRVSTGTQTLKPPRIHRSHGATVQESLSPSHRWCLTRDSIVPLLSQSTRQSSSAAAKCVALLMTSAFFLRADE